MRVNVEKFISHIHTHRKLRTGMKMSMAWFHLMDSMYNNNSNALVINCSFYNNVTVTDPSIDVHIRAIFVMQLLTRQD